MSRSIDLTGVVALAATITLAASCKCREGAEPSSAPPRHVTPAAKQHGAWATVKAVRIGGIAAAKRLGRDELAGSWRAADEIMAVDVRDDGAVLVREKGRVSLVSSDLAKAKIVFENAIDWSLDGRWVVGKGHKEVLVWDTHEPTKLPARYDIDADHVWGISPDGTKVLTERKGSVRIMNVGGQGKTKGHVDLLARIERPTTPCGYDFESDSSVLAFCSGAWHRYGLDGRKRGSTPASSAYYSRGARLEAEAGQIVVAEGLREPTWKVECEELRRTGIWGPAVDRARRILAFDALPFEKVPARLARRQVVVLDVKRRQAVAIVPELGGKLSVAPDASRVVVGFQQRLYGIPLARSR